MKKALVYSTLTGTVKKCADIIAEKIEDIELINIKKQKGNTADYDMIIIGGAYYMGKLPAKLRKYIKSNKEALLKKPYAIFISCSSEDDYKEVLVKNIGKELVENALAVECFGCEIITEQPKGYLRFIAKMTKLSYENEKKPLPELRQDKIAEFITRIKSIKKTD